MFHPNEAYYEVYWGQRKLTMKHNESIISRLLVFLDFLDKRETWMFKHVFFFFLNELFISDHPHSGKIVNYVVEELLFILLNFFGISLYFGCRVFVVFYLLCGWEKCSYFPPFFSFSGIGNDAKSDTSFHHLMPFHSLRWLMEDKYFPFSFFVSWSHHCIFLEASLFGILWPLWLQKAIFGLFYLIHFQTYFNQLRGISTHCLALFYFFLSFCMLSSLLVSYEVYVTGLGVICSLAGTSLYML